MSGKSKTPGFFWTHGPPDWVLRLREARQARARRDRGGRGENAVNEARNRMRGIRSHPRHRAGRQR